MSRVLVIGDLHLPFIHKDALDFLEAVKDAYDPDIVVQTGDFADNHAISYHDTDPDGMSAGDELSVMQGMADKFFNLFPEGYMCDGNHSNLPWRKAITSGIPRGMVKTPEEIMHFPKGWLYDKKHIIDGVVYEHGEKHSGLYAHVHHAKTNMRSTVIGHLHSLFGVQYVANDDKLIFGAAAGCLIDTKSYAMHYGNNFARKPILGVLIVDNGIVVEAVPMLMDYDGNWIGEV